MTATLYRLSIKRRYLSLSSALRKTEKEEGTGIGLPLSRSLAQLHKGSLELKTSIEGFNIFLLSLPIHQEREIRFGGDSEEEPIVKCDG